MCIVEDAHINGKVGSYTQRTLSEVLYCKLALNIDEYSFIYRFYI